MDTSIDRRDESFSESPSLNDDLLPSSSAVNTPTHRRLLSSSTLSSFRPSFDDSSISLGINRLSSQSISPLGQNSIYELVQGAERSKRHLRTISVNGGTTTVHLKGPSINDIPAVKLPKITKANPNSYKPYLESLKDYFNEYESNNQLTEKTLETYLKQVDEEDQLANDIHQSAADASLQDIPSVYFQEDFRLDNPRVFETVVEGSHISLQDGSSKSLANNNLLQEKLSWYLDTVEVHLINEISKSSGSFFTALDDLNKITTGSKVTAKGLLALQERVDLLDEQQAKKAINILQKIQKRINTEILEQSLLQVQTILQQADLAEATYLNGNYEKALDQIDSIRCLIKGDTSKSLLAQSVVSKWPYPLQNLTELPALSSLKHLLKNLESEIGRTYCKMFVDFLIEDLRNHYDHVSKHDTLYRLSSNLQRDNRRFTYIKLDKEINNSFQDVNALFKEKLSHFMKELSRCGELTNAFGRYEQQLLVEVKSIVRSFLPEEDSRTSSHASQTNSTQSNARNSLSDNLRLMTPREFEDMLIEIYCRVSEALRRLTIHQKALLDMSLDFVTESDFANTSQTDIIMTLDITKSILTTIDVVQTRVSKVIGVRREQTAQISLDYFLRFYSVNGLFLYECEMINGGNTNTTALQDAIGVQTKLFNTAFHSSTLKLISESIEKEPWKSGYLPNEFQTLLNQVIQSANEDPEKWINSLKFQYENNVQSDPEDIQGEERKTLSIDQDSFIVPTVVFTILRCVKNYEMLKLVFPQHTLLYYSNVCEFLRLMNVKIQQSVLKAGATRTAGLKHITSKHLVICSQLLRFIVHLIPHVKNCFLRSVKQEDKLQVAEELDKIKDLFFDHENEIFAKLVSIMTDRFGTHSAEIKRIDWSQNVQSGQCHRYMEILVKETLTICNVLQTYLPENQYTSILSGIFDNYKRLLLAEYTQVHFKDSIEKAIMMRDVDYFRAKLGDVVGYNDSGQVIWEKINSMPTDEDERMAIVMNGNIAQERKSVEVARSSLESYRAATPGKWFGRGKEEKIESKKPKDSKINPKEREIVEVEQDSKEQKKEETKELPKGETKEEAIEKPKAEKDEEVIEKQKEEKEEETRENSKEKKVNDSSPQMVAVEYSTGSETEKVTETKAHDTSSTIQEEEDEKVEKKTQENGEESEPQRNNSQNTQVPTADDQIQDRVDMETETIQENGDDTSSVDEDHNQKTDILDENGSGTSNIDSEVPEPPSLQSRPLDSEFQELNKNGKLEKLGSKQTGLIQETNTAPEEGKTVLPELDDEKDISDIQDTSEQADKQTFLETSEKAPQETSDANDQRSSVELTKEVEIAQDQTVASSETEGIKQNSSPKKKTKPKSRKKKGRR
ncbi:Vacuolar protein sorting-associated protein 54 [Komagataella phaffii CBS 7435]|uniref:Component of the GARP (Golgi-associated retrograde protein) complex n=2 Tax=Komagataella phaffii TaxID=460519 RepID=C4QWR8_KOMPG|nr:Component of the GARP (Golgi-associated retrograde protein) complex [Komagataella phaffii GS115]AOA60891.1 GQ67_02900T0 [Komagataella phaffii]CAH2446463.1 Vacuolar protein sorting-associated protein 54 [Komagataella phaffii CBS 7435]AOA65568.1 GQ68_02347T0 [Komagataella phaffii GS115]CAY67691.1 Component of the GARP (Golgi-associated retrograde protein) complex [Komagataella phaffii GS115]CCA36783.1 Vacuolar protein sorting-associated protein 54 [Komagataella phaffii CBS 7435]